SLAKPEDPKPEDPKPQDPKPEQPKPEAPADKPVITKPVVKDKVAKINNKAVEAVKNNGTLVLDLKDNDTTIKVSLSKEQVRMLKEKNAEIVIQKADVTIVIPASILTNGNEAVEIIIQKMKDIEEALSSVYDFTIVQGGKVISNFDKPVTLTFSVDESKVKDPKNVNVFYWNPDSEVWELVGGNYSNGFITVETPHFSTFTVFETDVSNLTLPVP